MSLRDTVLCPSKQTLLQGTTPPERPPALPLQVLLWALDLPHCTRWLCCPFRGSQAPHLQVGDVAVNVHGGRLAILRDVLIILGARLPIHAVDAGDGHVLRAPSHIPGKGNGAEGSSGCQERTGEVPGPWGLGWGEGGGGSGCSLGHVKGDCQKKCRAPS